MNTDNMRAEHWSAFKHQCQEVWVAFAAALWAAAEDGTEIETCAAEADAMLAEFVKRFGPKESPDGQ